MTDEKLNSMIPMDKFITITENIAIHTEAEMKSIKKGFRASVMEEKWNLIFQDDILYCIRSWTGYCGFKAFFRSEEKNFILYKIEYIDNPTVRSGLTDEEAILSVKELINGYLLRESQ